MFGLLNIARKELKIYFTTPVAYVVIALFTALASVFFWSFLTHFMVQSQLLLKAQRPDLLAHLNFNDSVITPLFVGYVQIVFLFVLPLLTMRLIAEERHSGTMELLLSSPIKPWQILGGKYLAALVLVVVMTFLCLTYPLLLQVFGRGVGEVGPIDWGSVWVGLLGLLLVGATCAAVGLFTSSITESQMVAAITALMILLFFWVLRGIGASSEGLVSDVLLQLSIVTHIEPFARGLLSLSDLVYFIGFIIFFLFLSHRAIEGLRWS